MTGEADPRRSLPGVDRLLETEEFRALCRDLPRPVVVRVTRQLLEEIRAELVGGAPGSVPQTTEEWAEKAAERARALLQPSLRRVINGTGVVLHTNLGRAPLAAGARRAMTEIAEGYSNLEFDLHAGGRGSRYLHCTGLLRELTGAEDALVVNNCAAALVLALNTLALGRGVAVSRGEMVEIGGGFRIPEMLDRSGCRLVEVGATNRTRCSDYTAAISSDPELAALLKVHRSNFKITGFTEEASLEELVSLGSLHGIPVVFDLGSGLMMDSEALGLPHEPTAARALRAGVGVVLVSGDKLLGGPQAGILLGQAELIERMRENPLCRALRLDKVALAGLEATLSLYRDPAEAKRQIPTLRMLSATADELEPCAAQMMESLKVRGVAASVAPGVSVVGGGTYPGVELPTWVVRIPVPKGRATDVVARALREGEPPVILRIEGDELVIDPRTVEPADLPDLLGRLEEVWALP